MTDLRPFLANVAVSLPCALDTMLVTISGPPAVSPWTPGPTPGADPEVLCPDRGPDVDAIISTARDRGRAEGLAETAVLRARLQALLDELTTARAAVCEAATQVIADAATAVVAAWTEHAPPRELFSMIVRAWTARCRVPATAKVAPALVDTLREAIGDAPITVEPDPTLDAGAVRICAPTLELDHDWAVRIRQLHEAIATALEASA